MTQDPLRIAIMNRQYDNTIGGVERASIRLANEMAQRGHDVHVVSLDMPDGAMPFALDERVHWHRISNVSAKNKAGWKERLNRHIKIYRILKNNKIDCAVGFQDGAYLSLKLGSIGTGIPIIAAERNAPSRFDFLKNKKARAIAFNSFRFAACITVQCPSYVDQYPPYLRKKIQVIPNSVDSAETLASPAGENVTRKEILFVGRLDYQKNVETLVFAFAALADKFPDWILRVVGGGPHMGPLMESVEKNGLTNRVIFEGSQNRVTPYYVHAHIFCLPSLWEGFPNVLGEAMAHGLPSVGYKDCSGVCDLIGDGETGILAKGSVKDPKPLSQALEKLMADADLRVSMGHKAMESIKAYRPDIVYAKWEGLFKGLSES